MGNKISIIIPCYNDGKYIIDALESLNLEKNKNVFEVIIVDDGSDDPFTIKNLSNISNNGYLVLRQNHRGLAAARNLAIRHSTSDYILPLDSDNKIVPEVFLKAHEIMEKKSTIDVVYTHAILFGEKSALWENDEYDLKKILQSNYIDACALIRKRALIEVDFYSEDMPVMGHEDWELWIKLGVKKKNFYLLREPGFYYRVHYDSMVNTISSPRVNETYSYIFKKHSDTVLGLYFEFISEVEKNAKKLNEREVYIKKNKIKHIIKIILGKKIFS
jgi:glycosyltransferase involved in cell wall biosynthesis